MAVSARGLKPARRPQMDRAGTGRRRGALRPAGGGAPPRPAALARPVPSTRIAPPRPAAGRGPSVRTPRRMGLAPATLRLRALEKRAPNVQAPICLNGTAAGCHVAKGSTGHRLPPAPPEGETGAGHPDRASSPPTAKRGREERRSTRRASTARLRVSSNTGDAAMFPAIGHRTGGPPRTGPPGTSPGLFCWGLGKDRDAP